MHNVSPIKISEKNKKWFECTLQTTDGNIRGVCFDPSLNDVSKFKQVAESKSPIKLQNTRLSNKRPGFPQDIIIPKKAMLEHVDPLPDFECQSVEPSTVESTIGNLNNLKMAQLITLVAHVNCLTSVKQVTQKSTQCKVDLRECQLTDTSGSTKLTLWGKFTTQVENGKTYEFVNLRIKSENGKVHLSTTQTGCAISPATPLANINPPNELPSSSVTEHVSIQFLTRISSYNVCVNCKKKVVLPEKEKSVKCENCHAKMNKTKCPKCYYAKIVVTNDDNIQKPLTFFNDTVQQLINIYNNINVEGLVVKFDSATEKDIEDAILELDKVKVTHDNLKVHHVEL